MQAVVVFPKRETGAELRLVPDVIQSEDEVLVKVLEVGVDGTDRDIDAHEYGESPPDSDYLIIGHEAIGRVVSIGEKAGSGISVGDLVVSTVRRPDLCPNCRCGQPDMCLWGNYTERGIKGQHGYMAEYYTEKVENLIKVPDSVRNIAVLLEPISVVEKAIHQAFSLRKEIFWEPKTALILGAGPIGILAAFVLKVRGIHTYVYSREDRADPRAELLLSAGVQYIPSTESTLEQLPEKMGLADLTIEASGSGKVAFGAFDLIERNGVLVLTSVSGKHQHVDVCADCINLNLVLGNKAIIGSVNAHRRDFEQGLRDMQVIEETNPGLLSKMISRKVPLSDIRSALNKAPNEIKTIVQIAERD